MTAVGRAAASVLALGAALLLAAGTVAAMSVAPPPSAVDVGTCPDAPNRDAVGAVVVVAEEEAGAFPGLTDPVTSPPAGDVPYVLARDLPKGARLIPPGTMVTRDFRPDRLNLETDAAGVILRISCG